VIVDMAPGELHERLRAGKVYSPAKVERALHSFSARKISRRCGNSRCARWPMPSSSGRERRFAPLAIKAQGQDSLTPSG
jgi:hypothetical protein